MASSAFVWMKPGSGKAPNFRESKWTVAACGPVTSRRHVASTGPEIG